MSYISFECAREKDKVRQELGEAREQMLKVVKERSEQRAADQDVKRYLKGETNWILPSVDKRLKRKSKDMKKSIKKKKKKKQKKRSERKRKYSSSCTESSARDSDSSSEESNSTSSSSEEEKKRSKKSKKTKKKSKKNKSKISYTEESDCDEEKHRNVSVSAEPLTRDSWMTSPLILKTYTKEKLECNEIQQIEVYNPVKSNRELNPYWKTTGTGLPSFLKPKEEGDEKNAIPDKKLKTSSFFTSLSSTKSWKKHSDEKFLGYKHSQPHENKTTSCNKHMHCSKDDNMQNDEKNSNDSTIKLLTDQEMNELGAKVLKAELSGNILLANKLRENLENARTQRNLLKESQKQKYTEGESMQNNSNYNKKDEHIVLIHTDQAGCSRPLPTSKVLDTKDLNGSKRKQKQTAMKTHNEFGDRVRYFIDDDRYNIKEMFQREKYKTASDVNFEFANFASKRKNRNDDMDDIFEENICKDDSFHSNKKEHDQAIREHKKIEAVLDNCSKCLDSTKMQKELLICVGEKVYLALPWYQGLQEGHCMIITNQHVTCCTQIDEDTWTEINDIRKALTSMFLAQHKDVIFFEIANRLHKRSHLVIHCVPVRESDGEMAPFYFKKAIEESEREWCINKQLVSLRHKSLRSCIPKGLPYFWVNFGMDTGFAHVIEDEERFPENFAQEIIGGMLNLDAKKWRKLQREPNIIIKVKTFANFWKKFDCTNS